ncbi:MAG: ATP-binding protein [Anaerolineae bacterium]|nr:ATP-binding protein [Anaerolineae bacterium]
MPVSNQSTRPTSRLADRLIAVRRERFVGREAELELFRSGLLAVEPPFAVLHIYGPGGVGKSTLLREYARMAAEADRPVILIDRDVEPSPPGFGLALCRSLGFEASDADTPLEHWPDKAVLLIDTYELLTVLDGWLRETFLPQLPADSLVVIAGRNTPASAWRTDIAWVDLTRFLPLRNLHPEESQTYLAARGIPEEQHAQVLAFTHGHPLALSLVAEVMSQGDNLTAFKPQTEPDVVRILLERFTRSVPNPQFRQALEMCAHAPVTTEALLAEVLGAENGHLAFTWLRGLSFIEQGPRGLFPHDLARDVLDVDLRWRNPDSYQHLHRQVRRYFVRRLQETRGLEQQQATLDWLFLQHYNSLGKSYLELESFGSLYALPAKEQDYRLILDIVRQHEGEVSAQIVEYWLRRQPQAFTIFYRTDDQQLNGFLALLDIDTVTPEDLAADPALKSAWTFARRYGPVRSGEAISYKRFWMDGDTYQVLPSATLNMVSAFSLMQWLTHPKLAWSFAAYTDPDYWQPLYSYISFQRSSEADFEIDGRHFRVFSHDWRAEPSQVWLEVMAERELATGLEPDLTETTVVAPVVVLSETEFAEAVRQALRDYTQPDLLAANPLMRSRLVIETSGLESSSVALQTLLQKASNSLTGNPKTEKFYRAVIHTYLKPAATQEAAAELLDLPFGTYRYHLAKGVERITEWLWQRELHDFKP